jgi:hypothetical protein
MIRWVKSSLRAAPEVPRCSGRRAVNRQGLGLAEAEPEHERPEKDVGEEDRVPVRQGR